MKKIQFQLMCSVIRPPTSGPIASASAETPTQIPIAVPRCRGGNVTVMIESVAGFISAAPRPCTTRARDQHVALPARPHASDESGEDDEADDEDQAPPEQVGELAAGEHQRAEGERVAGHDPLELRDREVERLWIAGSATFTTVLSSMIMKRPNATAASVHHFLFSSRKASPSSHSFVPLPGRRAR